MSNVIIVRQIIFLKKGLVIIFKSCLNPLNWSLLFGTRIFSKAYRNIKKRQVVSKLCCSILKYLSIEWNCSF